MTTNTTNQEAQDIHDLLCDLFEAGFDSPGRHESTPAYRTARDAILAYIDAKLAQAGDDWRDRAYTLEARLGEVMENRDELRGRATAAESRLAEIQRGVHGLDRYGFDGKFGGDFGGDPLGPFVKIDEVRALLRPPSQSDTINLTQQDTEMLIDLIENPPAPNELLQSAFDNFLKDKYE